MVKDATGNMIAKLMQGIARIIRNSLPKATYIGFTGTPISLKDRSTKDSFRRLHRYLRYDPGVADGATRPVYYESRVIKLKLDPDILQQIDDEYKHMQEEDEADEEVIEASKSG